MDDQQAIERYRYMLRTAPPDDIERAHEEADDVPGGPTVRVATPGGHARGGC